jgi:hypothetical protein
MPLFCTMCNSWNCVDNNYNMMCYRKVIELLSEKLPLEISKKIIDLTQVEESYHLFKGWLS